MDESITMSTQQLKHLNQKTNILWDRKGLDAWERKINIYIKTYKMVKKIIKEIQVNEQICTNLKGARKNILLNAFPAYSQTKLIYQPIGKQLISGLVCNYVGQAFNKMLFLPPF
jgi:hypothetical protein